MSSYRSYLVVAVLVAVVSSAALTTILSSRLGVTATGTLTTGPQGTPETTVSSTYSTSTTSSYLSTSPHSTKPAHSYVAKAKELVRKSKELWLKGYDTTYAHYLVLSSKWLYAKGDREEALKHLQEAEELLCKPLLRPELPKLNFRVVTTLPNVRRAPTTWDFVPLGTVYALSDKGYLVYPRGDTSWKLSCFIIVAVGRGPNGEVVAYQGRLPLRPSEGVFRPRLYVGGRWVVPNMVFAGPLYYTEGGKGFKYPTVYQYDLSGRYMQYLTYVPSSRTWVHAIVDTESGEKLLELRGYAEGAPMWLGVWNETYRPHGVYSKKRGIDLWAGFWDIGRAVIKVRVGGKSGVFRGFFVFDRASHRTHLVSSPEGVGAPIAFTCMVIYGRDFTIAVASSKNPSPLKFSMQHQLRISIPKLGVVVDITNFTLIDSGGLQPKWFRIYADLPNGYLNITGKVIGYWPPTWPRYGGTWWNPKASTSWGRAFTLWEGKAVINGKEIHVKAVGVGEYTRYSPKPHKIVTCSEACWAGS